MHFLMTTNKNSAEELTKLGFQLVSKNDNSWIFLNNENLKFSHVGGVVPTNKMLF